MKSYDFSAIEKRAQEFWRKEGVYEPSFAKASEGRPDIEGKPFYNLMMFPYPSAEGLHVGNMYAFTGSDIYGRFKRMQGNDVFEPIGLDGFGIHSENYALKVGTHPKKQAEVSEKRFYEQLESIGNGFAWNERLETYDPEYYKWTQWIFVQLFKAGLAYRKKQAVNWCPSCKTVLADEQVIAGKCERCSSVVEKRELEQWFFKITKYASQLLENLEKLDWSGRVKIAQRNWIGKSEGAELDFEIRTKDKPNFLILHGYTGRATKNFIPWLKAELEKSGYEVQAPELPNTDDPKEEEQVGYVTQNCKIDSNTIIVGHSLGAVVAMKVLEKHNQAIHGLVLVAAAMDPDFVEANEKPFWKSFKWDIDYKRLQSLAPHRLVLSDLNETKRKKYLEELSEKIEAVLVTGAAQKEHFCAEEEPIILDNVFPKIKVFTTRPDTLFGATYMVVAPEHPIARTAYAENQKEVQKYLKAAQVKSEEERLEEGKEKTGIELKGVKAVNPATKEEIPVWVADYVLGGYGTGAIMAVPAHDERDYEFAKKYHLPIRHVVMPSLLDETNPPRAGKDNSFRNIILAILYNPKTDKYLTLKWKKQPWRTFITGGVEDDENRVQAAEREIMEETGYKNVRLVRSLGMTQAIFFAAHKNVNRRTHGEHFLFELVNDERVEVSQEEKDQYDMEWLAMAELRVSHLQHVESSILLDRIQTGNDSYVGAGILINSGDFNGLDSEEAKKKVTEFAGGRLKTQFRLRDWLISRQRYWGPPIPMIHCEKCSWQPVPEKDLPVLLPEVKNFRPTGTGESPLASEESFYRAKCPNCGGEARRETDVSDTFLDSAWYYLRYPSTRSAHSEQVPWDPEITKKWFPVNMYIGGAEHSVLHLLYVRFLSLALHDLGLLEFGPTEAPKGEPFPTFRAHGLVIKDGAKMSKSKGNVVNPDEYIKKFGADALRMYLMFLAPFEDGGDFRDKGILGVTRFLDRVWKMSEKVKGEDGSDAALKAVHRTAKKVTEDIESLHYNTAVSALMICLNDLESEGSVGKREFGMFLRLLAPFAPHLAEILWQDVLKEKSSIHLAEWPKHDKNLVAEEKRTLVIQINGKMRDIVEVEAGFTETQAKNLALGREKIKVFLNGKTIKKTIYVEGKILNLVL